jgi:hypothetical protein
MKKITVYTPEELKEANPRGFEIALEGFRAGNEEIPWTDEIMDSLKALFKASGIALRDWSIGAYSYSYVKFDMEEGVQELSGSRALAWLENNLFSDLRERRRFINRVKKYEKWHDFTKFGEIPSCPLTSICFDEDFIESLVKDIKAGDSLKEAYENLASVASKLFEAEYDYQNSEENFLEQNHLQFTEDGRSV